MLLAIDIGNTNTSFGIFDRQRLKKRFDMPTFEYAPRRIRARLGRLEIHDTVICSVAPRATIVLRKEIRKLAELPPYIIGKGIDVPVPNLYRRKSQVGQDRLVNAYAAKAFYGTPAIVVDFGTAVTLDVISRQGAYLGGLILPGLQLSLRALAEHTALLPALNLSGPRELIGRDTRNSILSGVVIGLSSAVDELCIRIKKIIGRGAVVIGTGGNVGVAGRHCGQIRHIDKDLTLKGIAGIFVER